MFVDYYELLGVSSLATEREIKKAYRQKAKIIHSDTDGRESDFILLTKAYDALLNPFERSHYDHLYKIYKEEHKKEEVQNREYTNKKETTSFKNKYKFWLIASLVANTALSFGILQLFHTVNNQNSLHEQLEKNIRSLTLSEQSLKKEMDQLNKAKIELEEEHAIFKEQESPLLAFTGGTNDRHTFSTKIHSSAEIDQLTPKKTEGYFTLGSSVSEVKDIMGIPSSISSYNMTYEYSSISLENGRVTGWDNISENLKVIIPQTDEVSTFGVGSTRQEVINVMGTPRSYSDYSMSYEYSFVSFDNGVVSGWDNISNNLKVK